MAIQSSEFVDEYQLFVRAAVGWVTVRIGASEEAGGDPGIPSKHLDALGEELTGVEATEAIRVALSRHSLRSNAALVILVDEYRYFTTLHEITGSNATEADEELSKIAAEAVVSTKEVLDGLPPWLKASLAVLKEMLNMALPGRQLWERFRPWKKKKTAKKKRTTRGK